MGYQIDINELYKKIIIETVIELIPVKRSRRFSHEYYLEYFYNALPVVYDLKSLGGGN